MTDYDYTNRVELTGSTSKNGATDASGYPLDIAPDANWPGLSADPNQITLHAGDMTDIAGKIDLLVQHLNDSGVLSSVQSTVGTSYGPPNWEAAVYLQEANKQVASTVAQYTTDLITNLTHASAAIRRAATGYTGAETTNTQSANNQQSSIPNNAAY